MSRKNTFWAFLIVSLFLLGGIVVKLTASDNTIVISSQRPYSSPEYRLDWEENFDGEKLDETKWSKCKRRTSQWNRHMSNEDRLYQLKKGRLRLYCMNNTGWAKGDTARVVTGGITTENKYTVLEGKVEVRARMSSVMGCWPAIWMGHNKNTKGVTDPKYAEIDIMEHFNLDKKIQHNTHNAHLYNRKKANSRESLKFVDVDPGKWHVYSVEILKDALVFRVDDNVTFTYPRKLEYVSEGQYPYTVYPEFLILSMQWGTKSAKYLDTKSLPAYIEFDWVRVYKPKNQRS